MRHTLWPKLLVLLLLILSVPMASTEAAAQNGGEIQVIRAEVVNNYPDSITFQVEFTSAHPIEKVNFYYKTRGSLSTQKQPVEAVESGTWTASYTWDTSAITIPPSTPILYSWEITDQAGNKIKTGEELASYDDNRFDWQELSAPGIILRWYDGGPEFGQAVFDVAVLALEQMKVQTEQDLEYPVVILLYANFEDFSSWHFYVEDWVGGQAFPSLGLTTQIIPASTNPGWIQDVIPHEIAHLFFYQVINTDIYFWPAWLDEGLAQYYEFTPNDAAVENAAWAAREGELLPLVLISGSFGSDPQRVRLAYDESYAVVVYILEMWGNEGLQKLISNFGQGDGYREAVEKAFGQTWEEFESGWIAWLGVDATPASPPTLTPTYSFNAGGAEGAREGEMDSTATAPPPTVGAERENLGTIEAQPGEMPPSRGGPFPLVLMGIVVGGGVLLAAAGFVLMRTRR